MAKLKFGLMKIKMNNHFYLFRIFLDNGRYSKPVSTNIKNEKERSRFFRILREKFERA
jgi:hypothetical protein